MLRRLCTAVLVGGVSLAFASLAQADTIPLGGLGGHGAIIAEGTVINAGIRNVMLTSQGDNGEGISLFQTNYPAVACAQHGESPEGTIATPNFPDPDLCVDKGLAFILQQGGNSANDGSNYDIPDDHNPVPDNANLGNVGEFAPATITFMFDDVVQLDDIRLIDVNGDAAQILTLRDINGNERIYFVPDMWTGEPTSAPDGTVTNNGFAVLDLNDLNPQGHTNNNDGMERFAVVREEDGGFLEDRVTKLIIGANGSGAWDRIRFTPTPEPTTAMMIMGGLSGLAFMGRRRRR